MIRKSFALLSVYFRHPLLMALFVIAGIFLIVAVIAELLGETTIAGFLGVYAVVGGFLGGAGYAALFAARSVSAFQRLRESSGA